MSRSLSGYVESIRIQRFFFAILGRGPTKGLSDLEN